MGDISIAMLDHHRKTSGSEMSHQRTAIGRFERFWNELLLRRRTQKAVQWWCDRQTLNATEQAESIRDGLLQEIFSLRRSMELQLALQPQNSLENSHRGLPQLEQIYNQLKNLAEQIAPLDLDTNFLFVIKQTLSKWSDERTDLKVSFDFPQDWNYPPSQNIHLILQFLMELLAIAVPEESEEVLINLRSNTHQRIEVTVIYSDLGLHKKNEELVDIHYLGQAFEFLVPGTFRQRAWDCQITYSLSW